jgi:hypothetical protein
MRLSLGLAPDIFEGAIHRRSSSYGYSPDDLRANPDGAWPTPAARVNKPRPRSLVYEE